MPLEDRVPNLEIGMLTFGTSAANAWSTEVLCAFGEKTDENTDFCFLSKECRSENIYFSAEKIEGKIFQTEKSEEFVMVVRRGQASQMTNADLVLLSQHMEAAADFDYVNIAPTDMPSSFAVEANCPMSGMRIIPPEALIAGLRKGEIPVRKLFMRTRWTEGGRECQMVCPCRYVNFASTASDAIGYVQPISGLAMYRDASERLRIGYIACALSVDGGVHIEFCAKRYANVFQWVNAKHFARSQEIFGEFSKVVPIVASVFDDVTVIDGGCDIFLYADDD